MEPSGSSPAGDHAPGRIGRYLVRREIGAGGMGVVYAAFDPHLDRTVAVKLLRGGGDEEGGRHLLREARAMAQLSHPNVVPVYDVGEHDGAVFITMEYVEGTAADRWLAEHPRPHREVLHIFFHAGLGLAAAHERGLVHRDFKPANVLVGLDRRVRVVDFGLARPGLVAAATAEDLELEDVLLGVDETNLTRTGLHAGTPAYMAPELLEHSCADPRADQFSFCVSLWEALYGERPFEGRSVFALAENVLAGRIRPAPPLSRVPAWLREILLRGLAADPERRFPSMKALLAAIAFTDRVIHH
jgi:serine/threonine protein kinase